MSPVDHPCTLENPIPAKVKNENFFAEVNSNWVVFQIGRIGVTAHRGTVRSKLPRLLLDNTVSSLYDGMRLAVEVHGM